MRHVGDVDSHFVVAVLQAFERQRVVEVLGIGRVDGESQRLAVVAAAFEVFLCRCLDFLGFAFGIGRKIEREVVFRQYRLHLDIVVARPSQPLHHASHGVVHLLGPVGHLHHSLLAVLGTAQVAEGNEDVDHHIAVVAHQEGEFLHLLHASHKACLGALQYLYHLAFRLVHFALRKHQHLHRVAVQGVARVVGGNHNILAPLFLRNDVGLAGLLHIDGADDVVLRQQVVVDVLGVDFVFAASLFDQDFRLGHLVDGHLHQLARGLVVGSHFRCYLFVIVRCERRIGKDFQYLCCKFIVIHNVLFFYFF